MAARLRGHTAPSWRGESEYTRTACHAQPRGLLTVTSPTPDRYAAVQFKPFEPVNAKPPAQGAGAGAGAGAAAPVPAGKKGKNVPDPDAGAPVAASTRSGAPASYAVKGGGKNGAFRMADQLPELVVALLDARHGGELGTGTVPLEALVLPRNAGSRYDCDGRVRATS